MATIQERAKEFAEREYYTDRFERERLMFGFYHGATEQRDIDIERAWQWMRQHINLIGSEMELHSQFVKAMKDENENT